MIKVGLVGGSEPQAGELLRLLVHHPDVDLVFVHSSGRAGQSLQSVHHGLIGDIDMDFTERCPLEKIDLLFVADPVWYASQTSPDCRPADLKIIDMTGETPEWLEAVPGVSEAYRKTLVRTAQHSRLLQPITSLGLVALFPLARNLLLKPLYIRLQLPVDMLDPGKEYEAKKELADLLSELQLSFKKEISMDSIASLHPRAMRMEITLENPMHVNDLKDLYESVYDDHNFTFLVSDEPDEAEVIGTNKCLIYITRQDSDRIKIVAVADARMRGGASEAMHIMNLMFGLHEKTGLALRASEYKPFRNIGNPKKVF